MNRKKAGKTKKNATRARKVRGAAAQPATQKKQGRAAPVEAPRPSTARSSARVSASATLFRTLVENGSDAVAMLSSVGTIIYAAPTTTRVLGYTPDEFVGRNAFDLVHPDDREHLNDVFDDLLKQTEGTITDQFRLRHKDGSWRWIESTGKNLIADLDVQAIVVSYRDITERKLSEEESLRTAAIIESSSDAIVSRSLGGTILTWNHAAERLFGYTAEEVKGRPVSILIPPDRLNEMQNIGNKLQRGDLIEDFETTRIRKDGKVIDVSITISPIKDVTGKTIGASAIFRDITERKRAEEQLRLLAHAVESTSELISITDLEDRFTFVNSSFLKTYGYEEQEVLGKLPAILISPNNPPDISKHVLSETRRGGWKGVLRNVRKDGTEFPIALRTSQIRNADGMAIGYMGVATDITVQKRTEEALRSSEERYRNLVENISEVYFVSDKHGLITYGSPNFFSETGFAPEEVLGRSYVRLIAAEDQRRVVQHYLDRTRDGTLDVLIEFRGRHKDGRLTWIEQATRIIRNEHGQVLEYRNVVRDISRRKEAEEQIRKLNAELEQRIQERTAEVTSQKNKLAKANEELANLVYELKQAKVKAEEASRAKSQFLTKISHELRTPLTSVIGFANTLLKNKANNLTQENITFLQRILDNGRHLYYLINDMLDLSKIEAGRMEIRLSPVSLQYLIEETVGELEIQLRPQDVQFRIEIPNDLDRLETDVQKLKQVLINLIGNALKFTERGTVGVSVEANAVTHKPERIHISDTGVGIPPERLGTIFEAFSQVDNTLARHYGGTGLGLTISRSLCQLMGYQLVVKSEINKGSTFSIVLSPNSDGAEIT